MQFEDSSYTIDELYKLRDKDGFIDLEKVGLNFPINTKEKRGSQDRIKNWVNFKGTKVLIKGERKLLDERNYGYYAELIVEEIGKKLNIPMAHYDLMKLKDKEGKEVYGNMSFLMYDLEDELLSIHDLIGDDKEDKQFIDSSNLNRVLNKLQKSFKNMGYSEDKINKLILEFKKRQAFSLLVLETDKHIENYSYIKGKDIYLSPNYDSEASLLLDNDIPTIKKILSDYTALKEVVDIALPRIGLINENNFNSYWKDTLDELIIDDDVYDYCLNVLCQKIDMDLILDKVEERIHAKLDDDVRLIAKYAYEERFRVFKQIIVGDI